MSKAVLCLLILIATVYSAEAINCFGTTCVANQYCQIQLNSQTASCYTHHGSGHHEEHQQCLGAHHPGDHCFCLDQACVDDMQSRFTTAGAAGANTTATAAAANTTSMVMTTP